MNLYYDSTNEYQLADPSSKMCVKAYQMRINSEEIRLKRPENVIPRPGYDLSIYINHKVYPARYDLQKFTIIGHNQKCYEITKNEAKDLITKYNGA